MNRLVPAKDGVQTEYTDCATCETSGTTLKKNGSYQPCDDTGTYEYTEDCYYSD